MADPAEALQRAVFAALRSSTELADAMGGVARVYDSVPPPDPNEPEAEYRQRVRMPYLVIGDDEFVDDSTTCERAWEANVTVHIWSRADGRVEAKRIGAIVRELLDAALTIDGFICTEHEFRDATYPKDPDGVTTHGVVQHRYLIDPA